LQGVRNTLYDAGNFDRGNGGRVVANSSTSAQSLVEHSLRAAVIMYRLSYCAIAERKFRNIRFADIMT